MQDGVLFCRKQFCRRCDLKKPSAACHPDTSGSVPAKTVLEGNSMKREFEILCPNCSEPIILHPDKSILEHITCDHCKTKHETDDLKDAAEKKENPSPKIGR